MTPPSIYLHFADKTDLMFQVCQQQWERFNDHFLAAVDGVAVIGFTAWSAGHGLTSLLISCPGMPWPDVDQLSQFVLARALQYRPERS